MGIIIHSVEEIKAPDIDQSNQDLTKTKEKVKKELYDEVEAEMQWLRMIDMNDDKDVERAAREILRLKNE